MELTADQAKAILGKKDLIFNPKDDSKSDSK